MAIVERPTTTPRLKDAILVGGIGKLDVRRRKRRWYIGGRDGGTEGEAAAGSSLDIAIARCYLRSRSSCWRVILLEGITKFEEGGVGTCSYVVVLLLRIPHRQWAGKKGLELEN